MVVAHVFMDTKKRQDYFFFLVTGTVKKPSENPNENLGENLVKAWVKTRLKTWVKTG